MEEQNVQAEEGINLVDVFRLLLRQIKYLILAVLIGGIVGGAFAVAKTYGVDYYGTTIEFYVNPRQDSAAATDAQYGNYSNNVMDTMVSQLNSQSFAEYLLLDGKPLPTVEDAWVSESDPAETQNLNALIESAQTEANDYTTKKTVLETKKAERETASIAYQEAKATLDAVWASLLHDGDTNKSEYSPEAFAALTTEKQTGILTEVSAYNTANADLNIADAAVKTAELALKEAKTALDVKATPVLHALRQTAKYKKELSKYLKALTFSYQKSETANYARSYLYVRISILKDEVFANKLLERVQRIVPAYVDETFWRPADTDKITYIGTNCTPTTTVIEISLTNPGYTLTTAIKYAFLLGALAFVVACVVVFFVDRADKRLRDPEDIKQALGVPVLGVVPTIAASAPPPPSTIDRWKRRNAKE